jgi:ribosomal protein L3
VPFQADLKVRLRLKGPVAVAQQDAHGMTGNRDGAAIGDGEVRDPVAVEIRDGDVPRVWIHAVEPRWIEATIRPPEQHRDGARVRAAALRHDHVRRSVTVEVANRDGEGLDACRIALERRERSVSSSEQHVHAVAVGIGHGQVGDPIPVEVAHRHGVRKRARADTARGGERPIAAAEQDAHRAASVCDRQVVVAVAVEVRDRNVVRKRPRRVHGRGDEQVTADRGRP